MCPSLPPRPRPSLAALVAAADAELTAARSEDHDDGGDGGDHEGGPARGNALLRVSAPDADPPGELAWHPIEGHPLDVLVGFVAPPHWWALGVSCHGLAHRLTGDGRLARAPGATRVRITMLVDRSGDGAGLMRRGDELTVLPGPPEGMVADACRRALRQPTAAPPATTVGLWTRCWLDRLVDAATATPDSSRPRLDTWRAVTRLHPASSIAAARGPGSDLAPDPDALAHATRVLADAWPWSRLRADPAVLDVPGPVPDASTIAWMDDGMWARWLLAIFPGLDDLVDAVCSLLAPNLGRAVRQVVDASLEATHDSGGGSPPTPPVR